MISAESIENLRKNMLNRRDVLEKMLREIDYSGIRMSESQV